MPTRSVAQALKRNRQTSFRNGQYICESPIKTGVVELPTVFAQSAERAIAERLHVRFRKASQYPLSLNQNARAVRAAAGALETTRT